MATALTCSAITTAQDLPLVIEGSLVTMSARGIVPHGALVLRNGRIESVLDAAEAIDRAASMPGAQRVRTNGWIFPGFINLHTHLPFNHQPLWVADRTFDNRYQWQAYRPYLETVVAPQSVLVDRWAYNLIGEQSLYSEVKALVGGTTSLAASPEPSVMTVPGRLVRNIEYESIGLGRVAVRVAEIDDAFVDSDAATVRAALDSGELRAWLVHLSEGIDERSRSELERLNRAGLLRSEVVVVHGTGLGAEELEELGAAAGHLVWAPTSNLLLYGKMADVAAAMKAGVTVSLSNDWAPSGTPNLLAELKIAAAAFEARYGESLPAKRLVEMITTHPARALGWESAAGVLAAGAVADIAVVHKRGVDAPETDDPYERLLDATEQDIALVLVNGDALYGEPEWMDTLKPGDSEVISVLDRTGANRDKRIDVTAGPGTPTFASVRATLTSALRFNENDMLERFLTAEGRPFERADLERTLERDAAGLAPHGLSSIFLANDESFFRALDAMGFPFTAVLRDAYRPFAR